MTTITRRIRPRRIKSVGVGENPPVLWRLLLLEPRPEDFLEPEFLEDGVLPEGLLEPDFLEPEVPEDEALPEEDLLPEDLAPDFLSEERPPLDLYSLANV